MKIINIQPKTKLKVENIKGFLKNRVTKYGTGAKVDCPKRYLGQEVYLIILENGIQKKSREPSRSSSNNRRAGKRD